MTTRIRTARVLCALAALLLIGGAMLAQTGTVTFSAGQWRMAGHDLNNSRSQSVERQISVSNAARLAPRWVFTADSDVSATPTVAGNAVYFPDWAGNLFAVRADTGQLLWSRKISDYNGRAGSIARVSPAVYEDVLVIGDNVGSGGVRNGANIIAIDRNSGALRWITQVESHPAAQITGSPVVFDNVVYVGVSSGEEGLARNAAYPCCTFRGSMVALDVLTGAMLWKTYTVPENGGLTGGYSGNAIWSPAAIDPARGSLYVGTGNNYTMPESVLQCQKEANARGEDGANCDAPDNYFDTVVAFDLRTGAIKWTTETLAFDPWTTACLSSPPGPNCSGPFGPDYDFASGPNLLGNIVGIGQKSGVYWALNADTGKVLWSTVVGPGGTLGGVEWGTASESGRIYVAIANNGRQSYTLANGGPTINWGSWAALDARTGRILWQIPDPTEGAIDTGSVSAANGVVYAGSYSGSMYAIEGATGKILWSFASGGTVIDGPSIVNGTVYWGSGYGRVGGTGNNKVYAFSVPPRSTS